MCVALTLRQIACATRKGEVAGVLFGNRGPKSTVLVAANQRFSWSCNAAESDLIQDLRDRVVREQECCVFDSRGAVSPLLECVLPEEPSIAKQKPH